MIPAKPTTPTTKDIFFLLAGRLSNLPGQ